MDPTICDAVRTIGDVIEGRGDVCDLANVLASLKTLLPDAMVGELKVDAIEGTVTRGGLVVRLSPTEMDILQVIKSGNGEPVANKVIMTAVYGAHLKRSFVTIRRYITDLRTKLAPLNCAIFNEYGRGYRLSTEGLR